MFFNVFKMRLLAVNRTQGLNRYMTVWQTNALVALFV